MSIIKKILDSKVSKAGLGYTIGNYLIKGLNILTLPIFTRLLTTEEYGNYSVFVSYEAVLFVIIGFAIHSSFKNAKYKYENEYESYVSSSFLLIIISSIIWVLIVFVFSSFLTHVLNLSFFSLEMLVAYSFSTAVLTCINSYCALNYSYKSYLAISAINAIGNVILSLFFIKTIFSANPYIGRIVGVVLPSFAISVFLIVYIFKKAKPTNNINHWRWGLAFSLPIVPHGISQVILNQFDRLMINWMCGSSSAGLYSFAYNIYSIISVTSTSLSTAWEPWFYEQMHVKEYDKIKDKSKLLVYIVMTFSILVMLASPELIGILGPASYKDAIYSTLPIVAGGFYAFIYVIPSGVEYYFGKTKYIAIGTTFAALLNVILNYVFINIYGYVAAAFTTFAVYFIYFGIHYFISRMLLKEEIIFKSTIAISFAMVVLTMLFVYATINYVVLRFIVGVAVGVFSIKYFLHQIK